MFEHVLSPFSFKRRVARNRVLVGAHGTNFQSGGAPTRRYVEYLRARARGGVALVVTEGSHVHPTSGGPAMIDLWRPDAVERLVPLVEAVQAEGALAFCQLMHAGRQIEPVMIGRPPVAPSPRRDPAHSSTPHALRRHEIAALVDAFAASADVARRAGFDGVELHCAHGYLIEQFLSPWSNQRSDEYGGSSTNRLRMAQDVIRAVLDRVGDDLVVGIRVNAFEDVEGGLGRDECLEIAATLAREGVEYVSVSAGLHATPLWTVPPAGSPLVPLADDVARVRAAVDCAVFASHRIKTLDDAEKLVASGAAQMVSMVRAHIADPELVRKQVEGRAAETRECIGCVQGCRGQLALGMPIGCLVNPDAGREDRPEPPHGTSRRVAVVGGGVAGMQAALTAARRGHDVVLYERTGRLGGALRLAAELPERQELAAFPDWLEQEIRRCGVEVVLCHEPSAADLESFEAVVVASGAVRPDPDPVAWSSEVKTLGLIEGLTAAVTGLDVLIVDRGDHRNIALLVARKFRMEGAKSVTVADTAGPVAARLDVLSALWLTRDIDGDGTIRLVPDAAHIEVSGDSVSFGEHRGSAPEHFDLLVVIEPAVASPAIAAHERDTTFLVGDCFAPGSAVEAVAQAHEVARAL